MLRLPGDAPPPVQSWYFIDKAVEGVLRDVLREVLEKPPIPLKLIGLQRLSLETLTLGGQPPKCGGTFPRTRPRHASHCERLHAHQAPPWGGG